MNEPFRRTHARSGVARAIAQLLTVPALLVPMSASPLGLGDITLHSALNQPLSAAIQLSAPGQVRSDEIAVRLASAQAFESAGIERSLLLTTLNFTVEAAADGTPYVKVSSPDAVKEPFLDFLVEIDWPSGHLLREYTLLLDPPVVLDEKPLPVETAQAGATAPVSAAEAIPAAETPVPATQPSAEATVSDGVLSYGPVQRTDTLWAIASQLQRAGDTASVEQIMIALLKSNPAAFYNGNINELKAGYVLRVTDPALLTALTRAAAVAEVSRQNEQWLDAKQARAGMAGAVPQGEPVADAAASGGAGPSGPHLRLSVPESTATGMALEGVAGEEGAAAGSPAAEVARLKAELAAALETSEASRQENTELRDRLAALQGQIDAMQRLTTLKDDTLAALQADAGQAPAQGEAQGKDAAKVAGKAAADAARKKAAKEPAGGKLLDDPRILAIGIAAVVGLLGLIWLVVRRRRGARLLEEMTADVPVSDLQAVSPAWAAVAPVVVEPASPEASVAPAATGSEEGGLDLMQAEEDEIDVLAEADVYLAYRRFDKAEELLREALKVEPGRRDLGLKLLEVLAAGGNKDAFVAAAESFKSSLGATETSLWDKAVMLGRRVAPEHVLFGGAAIAAAETAVATAGDAGLDLSAELAGLELDADISAELDKLGGETPAASAETNDGLDAVEAAPASLPEIELSLDEQSLSDSLSGVTDGAAVESGRASGQTPARNFGSASNVIDFESRAGVAPAAGAEAPSGGLDRDLDWLTGAGDDLGSLEDGEVEDDFSSLISGEDEVGTKLDLAKAYIDMGDQESARNILSEVVQEGSQDQQREANDLMRQIG